MWVVKALGWFVLFWLMAVRSSGLGVSSSHEVSLLPINMTEASSRCDRERARLARSIVQQFLLAPHNIKLSQLPAACPFHPSKDMFWEHELHKSNKNQAHRQCKYCNKVFRNEQYLDKHMQRKHVDRIPVVATSCLADLCNMLHCDWFAASRASSSRSKAKGQPPKPPSLRDVHCMPHEAADIRAQCMEMANTCFPVDTHGHAHHHILKEPLHHKLETLHEFWTKQFCQASTCSPGQKDKLLNAVMDKAGRPHRTVLLVLGLVGGLMLLVAAAVWVIVELVGGGSSNNNKHASQDPSGKTGRKPHAPSGSRAFGYNPQSAPYTVKRPAGSTAATQHTGRFMTGYSAGLPGIPWQPSGPAIQTHHSQQGSLPSGPFSPVSPLPVSTHGGQVVHTGSTVAYGSGRLHQRGQPGSQPDVGSGPSIRPHVHPSTGIGTSIVPPGFTSPRSQYATQLGGQFTQSPAVPQVGGSVSQPPHFRPPAKAD